MTISLGGGGGLKPPTSLPSILASGGAGLTSSTLVVAFGAVRSAQITSATLTEVLNISGSGYLTFSAIARYAGANTTDHKIRILVDGVEVLNDTSGAALTSTNYSVQVGCGSPTNNQYMSESLLVFSASFVVEIAGDGTNGVGYVYKRVLT